MDRSPSEVSFPSSDGLDITADLYEVAGPRGFLLLCHRSHSNRAEYRQTAPRLGELGFSCLAIDQRSGMRVFGEVNKTKERAKAAGLATGYLDAKPDVEAGIDYAYTLNDNRPIMVLGSSYSASLALLLATQTDQVRVVIAYSPGQCLKGIDLASELRDIDKPIYVTSPKAEIQQVADVVKYVDPHLVTRFIPTVDGFHGSKALWQTVPGHETYWTSLEEFLLRTR
jgi:alpha-beta hydrolase superfamily lysophospholipase